MLKYIFILLSLLILISCSSSNKISNSWKNPDAGGEFIKFQTVAVFAMVKNPDMRMDVEEALASQMPSTIAVPSYKIITNEELADINAVRWLLSETMSLQAKQLSSRNTVWTLSWAVVKAPIYGTWMAANDCLISTATVAWTGPNGS